MTLKLTEDTTQLTLINHLCDPLSKKLLDLSLKKPFMELRPDFNK